MTRDAAATDWTPQARRDDFLATVLDSLHSPVIVKDRMHRYVYVNRAGLEISPFKREELLGKRDADFLPDDIARKAVEQDNFVFETGETSQYTQSLRLKGRPITLEFTKSRIVDPLDGSPYVLAIGRDITDKRRIQEAAHRAEMLEALSCMAQGLRRQVVNCFVGVFGNTQIARKRVDADDPIRRCLDSIEWSAESAMNLLNQFASVFSPAGSAAPDEVRTHELLEHSIRFALGECGCQFKLVKDEDTWPVCIDRIQFSQAVCSLALSACERSQANGGLTVFCRNRKIDVSWDAPVPPGPYVRISFVDSGAPVPASEASRVFDPYFTLDGIDFGLRLSVAERIAAINGGALVLDPDADEGNVLHLYLPASPALSPAATAADHPTDPGPKTSCRIALIEPDPSVSSTLCSMLQELGHPTPRCFTKTDQVGGALTTPPPTDLILADSSGPNGISQTLTRIRQAAPATPVVLMRNGLHRDIHPTPDSEHRAVVLDKPFGMIALQQAIAVALARPSATKS